MANPPAAALSFNPPGPAFPITDQAVIPKITAVATLKNITPNPGTPLHYRWKVIDSDDRKGRKVATVPSPVSPMENCNLST